MDKPHSLTRRVFLAAVGGMGSGACLTNRFAEDAGAGATGALCVSVRDTHLGEVGESDAWSQLRAIGAQGVEAVVLEDLSCPNLITAGKPHSIASDDAVKQLADEARASGIRVTAFCMANRFDERPDEEVAWVARVARVCRQMEVGAIRIDVVPRRLQGDEFLEFAVAICKRTLEATTDSGVRLGIENHGRMTNDVAFLERLFDGVGSDRLGLTLDTGNFYWFGYPLSQLYTNYEKFAPRVFHTHCKSIAYPEERREEHRPMGWEYGTYNCPIYEGDIDFRRVVAILRGARYQGDLCVENESLGKFPRERRRDVLAKEIAFLKGLL